MPEALLKLEPGALAFVASQHPLLTFKRGADVHDEAREDRITQDVAVAEGLSVVKVRDGPHGRSGVARSGAKVRRRSAKARRLAKTAGGFVIGHVVLRRVGENQCRINAPHQIHHFAERGAIV